MTKKEQLRFDTWWNENRTWLIRIYNEEIDLNLAVLGMAELVWEGALNADKNNNIK